MLYNLTECALERVVGQSLGSRIKNLDPLSSPDGLP